jgi:hypothetical protein
MNWEVGSLDTDLFQDITNIQLESHVEILIEYPSE